MMECGSWIVIIWVFFPDVFCGQSIVFLNHYGFSAPLANGLVQPALIGPIWPNYWSYLKELHSALWSPEEKNLL